MVSQNEERNVDKVINMPSLGYVHIPSNYGTIKVPLNLVQLPVGTIDPSLPIPVAYCDELDFYGAMGILPD